MNKFLLKIWSAFFCTCLFTHSAFPQYDESIRADRPGQALTPYTVGSNVLQIQGGLGPGEYKLGEIENRYTADYWNVVGNLRYGITEHFEVNSAYGFLRENVKSDSNSTINDGLNLWTVGFRFNVLEGKAWKPAIGIQTDLALPWLSSEFDVQYVSPTIVLITNQNFGKRWGFTTNWGLIWSGDSAEPIGLYVLNLSYSLNNKWGVFAEQYAFFKTNIYTGSVDGGVSYLLNDDLQFDLYGGYSWGPKHFEDLFFNLGLSWRITFKKTQKKSAN